MRLPFTLEKYVSEVFFSFFRWFVLSFLTIKYAKTVELLILIISLNQKQEKALVSPNNDDSKT